LCSCGVSAKTVSSSTTTRLYNIRKHKWNISGKAHINSQLVLEIIV
jgi:hypothetical protein